MSAAAMTLYKFTGGQGQPWCLNKPSSRPPPTLRHALSEIQLLLGRDERAAAEHVASLVDAEAVVLLDDLLLRRTDWGANPVAGSTLAPQIARLIGWEEDRIETELRRRADSYC